MKTWGDLFEAIAICTERLAVWVGLTLCAAGAVLWVIEGVMQGGAN